VKTTVAYPHPSVLTTAVDRIAPGTIKEGFSFLLDPGICCYVVQYTDPTGAVVAGGRARMGPPANFSGETALDSRGGQA
jgi:hypothetical protein